MCPRCHSAEISRSRSKKIGDIFMRWFAQRPYRCRECNKRFYVTVELDRRLKRERSLRYPEDDRRKSSTQSSEHTEVTS